MTNKNQLIVAEKNITDNVLNRVAEMERQGAIQFPANYSYQNALKSAWLILQETKTSKSDGNRPVLEACTKESIANTLLDMVVQGLNPVKKQCYFIAYGDKLQLSRSYLGTVAVTKRLQRVKDVKGYALYEGDEFETDFNLETGTLYLTKYKPNIKNIDNKKLVGAFALIIGEDGPIHFEFMTMEQIKKAWNQGTMKGNSGAHNNFTEEMAKKTVINRACKMYVNTSDDSDILLESFNKTSQEVEEDIEANANKEMLDFPDNAIEAEYEAIDTETGEIESKKQPEPEF